MVFLALGGCSVLNGGQADWHTWAEGQGGVEPAGVRVETAAADLREASGRQFIVLTLKTDEVCAYSWDSGVVLVSRGLSATMDDQELRAAMAHELGHLPDRGIGGGSALRGGSCCVDSEEQADELGCALLCRCGVSRAAMTSMLQKTLDATAPSDPCRGGLSRRIHILQNRSVATN